MKTAIDFIKDADKVFYQEYSDSTGTAIDVDECERIMIEFAKYHVEEALKTASKNPTFIVYYETWEDGKLDLSEDNEDAHYTDPYLTCGRVVTINKNKILNAYPLEKIK
jgi:hypothetical protein